MNPLSAFAAHRSDSPGKNRKERKPVFCPKARLLSSSLLCFSLFAAPARATTYYIDSIAGSESNNGTSASTPWKTITSTSKVNTVSFQPGDQILFKRGSSWTGTLAPKGAGNSANPVVFDAYGTGAAPLIDGGGAASAVSLWDKNYVTFQNFRITNSGASPGFRIGIRLVFHGAAAPSGVSTFNGVKILNNEVHNVMGYTDRGGLYDTAAIYVELSESGGSQPFVNDLLIEGNDLHDNHCEGIYMKSPPLYDTRPDLWATNLVVRGNLIDQGGGDAIVINGANGPLIEANASYDAGANAAGYGWIAGMWTCYHTRQAVFQYNEVARTRNEFINGVSGDSQAFDADKGTKDDQVFQYNYTHDNEGGVLIMMPEDVPISKKVIYRYNLSVNDGRNTNSGCQFAVYPTLGVNSATIYNNVFYTVRQEGFKFRDYEASYYYNNVFYAPAAIYPTRPTFSNNAYYGHIPDVTDPCKVTADPKFVGPLPTATGGGDGFTAANTDVFKLQPASPLINAGKAITAPIGNGGMDFWGNPLYAGAAADIGAHEVPGGSSPAPAPVTFVDDAPSSSIVYTGSSWGTGTGTLWYNGTRMASNAVGNYVTYTFSGTNVSLFGKMSPVSGKYSITIDGGAPAVVDCYWPSDRYRAELFKATGLSAGTHVLRATVAAKNPAAADNYAVVDYFLHESGSPGAVPAVTPFDNTSPSVSYAGTWSPGTGNSVYYAGTRHLSGTIGSYATFTFTGTGCRIYGAKDPAFGKMSVEVDGGAAATVNCYQPTLADYQVRLYETNGLPYGTHTARVTVAAKDPASGGNNVVLDFFEALNGGSASAEIIMDNTDSSGVAFTGTWTPSTSIAGFYGGNYLSDGNAGQGAKSVRYTPTIIHAGSYQVFARWPAYSNRATNVPIDINHSGGTSPVIVNQQANGGTWYPLGTYNFAAGTSGSVLIRTTGANGYVIADAIRLVKP
jgi:hypothetical protein